MRATRERVVYSVARRFLSECSWRKSVRALCTLLLLPQRLLHARRVQIDGGRWRRRRHFCDVYNLHTGR